MLQGNKKDIEKLLPYVSERLQKALAYVAATDFSKVENGEYEIDGRNVFARVNTYDTEPKLNAVRKSITIILMYSLLFAVRKQFGIHR